MSPSNFQPAGHLARLRYQLGGCIIVAAVIPAAIRGWTLEYSRQLPPVEHAFYASVIAITFGIWLFRNVSTYPGIERATYVVPSFSATFGLALLFFIVSRLDYNRTVLIAGYVLSVAWFVAIHSRLQRRTLLRIGVLPFGERGRLEAINGVDWIELHSPDDDDVRLDAVGADLRTDLPSEWDARLADYALAGTPVYHTKHLLESLTGRVELEHLSENSFGSLAPVSAFMSFKMAVDWVVALVAGVLLLPVLVVIGIAIRLGSPGPALFRQQRIGYKGVPFTVYKFRTMTVAVEGGDLRAEAMTQAADARITKLGRWLRFTRLDELPQIINILKGEMSWIGPRPEAEILSRWYEVEIPFYRYRHIVRPGVTGWAQVCQGHVTDIDDVQSKLHYDFYYIKHYSAWIDLLIIARTVRTVVTGHGSR